MSLSLPVISVPGPVPASFPRAEMSAAAAEGKRPPLLVSGKQIAVEWPRERQAGPLPGSIAPPGMDGAAFLMLPPELQKEHQRRLDVRALPDVWGFPVTCASLVRLPAALCVLWVVKLCCLRMCEGMLADPTPASHTPGRNTPRT